MSMLTRRWRAASAALLVTVGLTAVGVASVAAKSAGKADHATSYVAVTHQVGSTYTAAGDVTDNNLGKGAVIYKITAGTGTKPGTIKITATRLTVFASTGSIYGTASGTETTLADGSVTLTGKLNLTHGTGAQKATVSPTPSTAPARRRSARSCSTPRAPTSSAATIRPAVRRTLAAARSPRPSARRRPARCHASYAAVGSAVT